MLDKKTLDELTGKAKQKQLDAEDEEFEAEMDAEIGDEEGEEIELEIDVTPDKPIMLNDDDGDDYYDESEDDYSSDDAYEIVTIEENADDLESQLLAPLSSNGDAVAAVDVNDEYKRPFLYGVYDWIEVFCYALAAMVLVFLFVFKYVTVDGESMFPTLHNEDRLVITNFFYEPEPNDVIIVYSPAEHHQKPLVKRVIAVGGQEVTINFKTWEIFVDGKLLEQDYLAEGLNYFSNQTMAMGDIEAELWTFTVEEDHIFVMGDNRQSSEDSRYDAVGQLKESYVIGKVIFRIGPTDRIGSVD